VPPGAFGVTSPHVFATFDGLLDATVDGALDAALDGALDTVVGWLLDADGVAVLDPPAPHADTPRALTSRAGRTTPLRVILPI
jgi:hypothetical protein